MSAAVAAAAAATASGNRKPSRGDQSPSSLRPQEVQVSFHVSLYEHQKWRDWTTFAIWYLDNHSLPHSRAHHSRWIPRCSSEEVVEFLHYMDRIGKTKVHNETCPYFGTFMGTAAGPCPCPLKQVSGNLHALVGRLHAAFQERLGTGETNPFEARAVTLFLREVVDPQAKAQYIPE